MVALIFRYQSLMMRRRAGRGRVSPLTSLVFSYGSFVLAAFVLAQVITSPSVTSAGLWYWASYASWVLPARLGAVSARVIPGIRSLGINLNRRQKTVLHFLTVIRSPLVWGVAAVSALLVFQPSGPGFFLLAAPGLLFPLLLWVHTKLSREHLPEDPWLFLPLVLVFLLPGLITLRPEADLPAVLLTGALVQILLRLAALGLEKLPRPSLEPVKSIYRKALGLRYRLGSLGLWWALCAFQNPGKWPPVLTLPGLLWPLGTWFWFLGNLDVRRQRGGLGRSDLGSALKMSLPVLASHGVYTLIWYGIYAGGLLR